MGEQRSILLVDDTSRWHSVYKSALEADLDCQVSVAATGQQAIEMLAKAGPADLMMLDLNMPGMKGDEVLRRLRADPTFDQMPVIILTGETCLEIQEQLLEAGANDFVDKGAPYGLLLARLRAQIRQLDLQDQLTGIALDLDVFAAGILHDMHNLEHGLMAYGYLLDHKIDELPESSDKVEMKSYLGGLKEQLSRLSSYATDVIQAVRSTSGEAALQLVTWDHAIDWALSVVNSTQKGLGLPEVQVTTPKSWLSSLAQPQMMNLIALNLIQNAVKYGRSNASLRIDILESQELVRGKSMNVTRFCDNGTGIAKEDLGRIFQPFVRTVEATSSQSKGFGLGLALVSKAARAMKGQVWAELRQDGQPGAVFAVATQSQTPNP